ncbi:MAG: hypothetical protein FJW37_05410, partial [Acidobacteria bacterium]|nr:hypothetical protein [Acidobacteriota bacterium]
MLKRWIFWQLAVLVAVNLSIAWPLFSLDYGQYMLSNEGALVAVVRAVRNYWLGAAPDPFFWWPFWNAGMPFEHTYLPLLPLSAAAFSALTGAPPALSLHALAAFFYCLAPVGLFLFARAISAAPGPSFAAALAYSLISPSALLLPAIRADAGGALNPRRLQNVVFYGEGAHVASLALVPLALLFLYRSLKLGRLRDWLPAGVLMSAVALTNAFGAVALAIGVGCLLAVETKSAFGANLARVFVLSLSAYLWASPWIPPSLLASIASNSETVGGDYRPRLAGMLGVAAVVALCALLALLARRRGVAAHTGFFLLFGTALTSIPALAYAGEIFLLPQPHRYHLDMDLALCPLGAFGLAALGRRLPARARQAAVLLLVVFGASQLVRWREAARILVKPLEPAATVEHEIARLMEREFPGRRVMVAGTCMFWFNTFTDTPQLSGG